MKDKTKLQEIMEENREVYSKIDSDTRAMLEVVANVKIPEEFKVMEDREERYDMCKAFEDMRLEGYEEGIQEGIQKGIKEGMQEGIQKGIEEGMREGIQKGIEEGLKRGILALIQTCKELGASKEVIIEKCAEKFNLTGEQAKTYVKEYYG